MTDKSIVPSSAETGTVLPPCTCTFNNHLGTEGHEFNCASIRLPMLKKSMSNVKYKQLTSGIKLEKGTALSMDQIEMFDVDKADRELFPMKIGAAGYPIYRAYCADTMGSEEPMGETPYLINWTMGGAEADGVITSILVIALIKGEWSMWQLWSPAVEVLRQIVEIQLMIEENRDVSQLKIT